MEFGVNWRPRFQLSQLQTSTSKIECLEPQYFVEVCIKYTLQETPKVEKFSGKSVFQQKFSKKN